MARSAVIFTTLFLLPLLFLLLLIPDLNWTNMLPMLSQGIVPVLKAEAIPQGWISELFLMTYFLPYVTDQKKIKPWLYVVLGLIVIRRDNSNSTKSFSSIQKKSHVYINLTHI